MSNRYFDERMETLPPDLIRRVQDHRLRWQFRRCWDGSSWYRQRFEAAGLTPESFAGLTDVARLPLLSATDLEGVDREIRRVALNAETWATFGKAAQVDEQHDRARRDRAFWAQQLWSNEPRVRSASLQGGSRRERHLAACQAWSAGAVRTQALTSSAFGGLLAYECVQRLGRHWVDDHFLAEIVDPARGAKPDGQLGELVVTDLVRDAFPLIRYRTGLKRAITRDGCSCGRTTSSVWTARQVRAAGWSSRQLA